MVLPIVPLIIAGVSAAGGAAGAWWLRGKTDDNGLMTEQTQTTNQYFDNRAYSETTQYATQYFLAPVENANLTQSSATAIKQQQEAQEVGQKGSEQGVLTSGNLNTALIVAGIGAAAFIIFRGVK